MHSSEESSQCSMSSTEWNLHHRGWRVHPSLFGPYGVRLNQPVAAGAGLEATTAACCRSVGKDVTNLSRLNRGVAMVFQSYALYPHMTLEENMGSVLKNDRPSAAEIKHGSAAPLSILHLRRCCQAQAEASCRRPAVNAFALAAPLSGSRKFSCSMKPLSISTPNQVQMRARNRQVHK